MPVLLTNKSLESGDHDIVSGQVKGSPFCIAMEPHPSQRVRFKMSNRSVQFFYDQKWCFTFSVAYSKLQELNFISKAGKLLEPFRSREYGTTTIVDFKRLRQPSDVKVIGSRVLQVFKAMREIIVKDFPNPI